MHPLKQQLQPLDILVLTCIFFGQAILQSTRQFLSLQEAGLTAPYDLGFDQASIYWGIIAELVALGIAGMYLYWRRFDVRQLDIRPDRNTLPMMLILIVSAATAATLWDYLYAHMLNPVQLIHPDSAATGLTSAQAGEHPYAYLTMDYIAYALLNGVYEEIFFIGLIFCVPRQHLKWAIAYSLLVRFAFHTYQGLPSATAMVMLGLVFAAFRLKSKRLLPFMLAHSFFDLFGLGISRFLL